LSHLNFNQRIEVLSKRAYTNRHDQYFNQKEVGTEQELIEQNRNCSQGRRDQGKGKEKYGANTHRTKARMS
jgi:hypothetical protein